MRFKLKVMFETAVFRAAIGNMVIIEKHSQTYYSSN